MILGGLIYPLAVTGLGQWLFPEQANGSLILHKNGVILGSSLIGQPFTQPQYFHPRPSANAYDGSNSGGSNLGPTSRKLFERIRQDSIIYRDTNGLPAGRALPVDAVTASASGLDPHISLANAQLQIPRIASARNLPMKTVNQLTYRYVEDKFAESPYVNVLRLNLALDALSR
jgi:K+-transporting ATPase ATPase C chain